MSSAKLSTAGQFFPVQTLRLKNRGPPDRQVVEDMLLLDLRYALRQLQKNPGFAVTVVATAALGIGLTATIFSVIYGVLLSPLPFPNARQVVSIGEINRVSTHPGSSSLPNIRDWTAQNRSFQEIGYYNLSFDNVQYNGKAEQVVDVRCSPNLLSLLQTQPLFGRTFSSEGGTADSQNVAVISSKLWRNMFAADRAIVGRSLRIGKEYFTVIGIMPEEFFFPLTRNEPVLWILAKPPTEWEDQNIAMLQAVGRLKEGAGLKQAAAELTTILNSATHETSNRVLVENYRDSITGDLRTPLWLLEMTVLAVWIIACINVVGLLLVRAATRRREIAIRCALGARPFHVQSQFIMESALLAGTGTIVGLCISRILIDTARLFLQSRLPFATNIHMNTTVLELIILLSAFFTLLVATLPAFQVYRTVPLEAMCEGSPGSGMSRRQKRMCEGLVICEVALTVALLLDSGLLVHTLYNLRNNTLGFVSDHLVIGRFMAPPGRQGVDLVQTTYAPVLQNLEQLSNVKSAGISNLLPLNPMSTVTIPLQIQGRAKIPGKQELAQLRLMSRNLHQTLGVRLLRGRFFDERDNRSSLWAVIINQTLARKFFPNEDPLGKLIRTADNGPHRFSSIVGVVEDSRQRGLADPIEPQVDICLDQLAPSDDFAIMLGNYIEVAVKTKTAPEAVVPEVRRILQQANPDATFVNASTMPDLVERSLGNQDIVSRLVWMFTFAGLLIAGVGLYGSVAYNVSRSMRDIAVRLAFGARRSDILLGVLRQAFLILGLGLMAGFVLWQQTAQVLQNYLYGVRALDWPTILVVSPAVLICGLLASYFPARRASLSDPIQSLRSQ